MIQTVVFDTKPYEREALQRASAGLGIEWRFMDCRLSAEALAEIARVTAANLAAFASGQPFLPETALTVFTS